MAGGWWHLKQAINIREVLKEVTGIVSGESQWEHDDGENGIRWEAEIWAGLVCVRKFDGMDRSNHWPNKEVWVGCPNVKELESEMRIKEINDDKESS